MHTIRSQETTTTEQQLEQQAMREEEIEDDSYWQNLEQYKKHPLNLNEADATALKELGILNDLQVENFLRYRHLLGKLINIYELQAIPGWDIVLIRRLLPYISISSALSLTERWKQRFRGGDQSLLIRVSQGTGNNEYGNPQHWVLRYRYQYKQLLQFGLTADKDAGEKFFGNKQRFGFDHYSFHLFARKIGVIQSLAIGDFTVNMGQGLVQWQGLAFGKGSEVMSIKRQSAVLRPYSSAGEYKFFRGAGVTIQRRKIEATVFISLRKTDATIDSIDGKKYISTFQTSGYHRTDTEKDKKNNSSQSCIGAGIQFKGRQGNVGVNAIAYKFSLPINEKAEPYNLYAIDGSDWFNTSINYDKTWKNLHLFGEIAIDRYFNKAFVNGLLLSVDPRVDISFVHHNISNAYRAINGDAFTESTTPNNEKGLYTGISIRPASGWKVNAYADVFYFPWLKYRVDAPAGGAGYLLQVIYTPNKKTEVNTRFRSETKPINQSIAVVHAVVQSQRKDWRIHTRFMPANDIECNGRTELVWYNKDGETQTGFMLYADCRYKPLMKPYHCAARISFFETTGYDARIYSYESDVLYNNSMTMFSGKGCRFYVLLQYDIKKNISCWIKYVAQPSADECRLQLQWQW
jgi:hypothetical protein